MSEKPPRRKRYAGTHPRRFNEKYKELQPEKYAEELAKVRARGQTPAGTHVPIMGSEILEVLQPEADSIVLDCTLGFGGHAELLARRLGPKGRMLAVDLDAEEMARTQARLAQAGLTVHAHHLNFAGIGRLLGEHGLEGFDCILADLGVSSMQLDRPDRGFSFRHVGPLDMRMDRTRGQTASQWLADRDEEELTELLTEWGDEPDAAAIAAAVAKAISEGRSPETTADLSALVLRAKGIDPKSYRREAGEMHPAALTFQAIRMGVNREVANLEHLLRILPSILRPGGRAAILTFHSGEDRLVKKSFAAGRKAGVYVEGSDRPLRPSPAEVHDNPRARSAKLRWVRRG